jgi:hypothetical protein
MSIMRRPPLAAIGRRSRREKPPATICTAGGAAHFPASRFPLFRKNASKML